jgi:hypothetical protein
MRVLFARDADQGSAEYRLPPTLKEKIMSDYQISNTASQAPARGDEGAAQGTSRPAPSPAVEQIIARSLVDSDFRDLLFANRSKALEEYDLTDADREALNLLDERSLNNSEEVALIVGATCSAFVPSSPRDEEE